MKLKLAAETADFALENWFVSHCRFLSKLNDREKSKFQLFHSLFNKMCLQQQFNVGFKIQQNILKERCCNVCHTNLLVFACSQPSAA